MVICYLEIAEACQITDQGSTLVSLVSLPLEQRYLLLFLVKMSWQGTFTSSIIQASHSLSSLFCVIIIYQKRIRWHSTYSKWQNWPSCHHRSTRWHLGQVQRNASTSIMLLKPSKVVLVFPPRLMMINDFWKSQLSPEEEKAIIAGFNKPDQVQANGIRAGGVKYFTIQAGTDNIYGKKGVSITRRWLSLKSSQYWISQLDSSMA